MSCICGKATQYEVITFKTLTKRLDMALSLQERYGLYKNKQNEELVIETSHRELCAECLSNL